MMLLIPPYSYSGYEHDSPQPQGYIRGSCKHKNIAILPILVALEYTLTKRKGVTRNSECGLFSGNWFSLN